MEALECDTRLSDQAAAEIRRYLVRFPDEAQALAGLKQQVWLDAEEVGSRGNMRGHITVSVLAVDFRCARGLLILHRASSQWGQPGGHFEMPLVAVTESVLFDSGVRELGEETGLAEFSPLRWDVAYALVPLDIDCHLIASRPQKGENAHVHHDFLYIVEADSRSVLEPQLDEVCDARWFTFDEIRRLGQLRLTRVLDRLQILGFDG